MPVASTLSPALGAVLGDASSSAIITSALAALLALLALLRGGRQPARVPVPVRTKRDRPARR